MTLGEYIEQKRRHRQLSQEAVAHAAGVSRFTIINLETRPGSIKFDTLRAICTRGLHLSPTEWRAAICLWLKPILGPDDFDLLLLSETADSLRVQELEDTSPLAQRLAHLPDADRQEIARILDKPDVLKLLRHINDHHDNVQRKRDGTGHG